MRKALPSSVKEHSGTIAFSMKKSAFHCTFATAMLTIQSISPALSPSNIESHRVVFATKDTTITQQLRKPIESSIEGVALRRLEKSTYIGNDKAQLFAH